MALCDVTPETVGLDGVSTNVVTVNSSESEVSDLPKMAATV